jgi:sulfate adenylyltransferase
MIDEEEYLISYANLKSNLFKHQKNFCNPTLMKKFYSNAHFGFPICLPKGIKFFNYSKAKYFEIDIKSFSKIIFKTNNINYVGVKKFFRYGNLFAFNVSIKTKYKKKIESYINKTNNLKKKIKKLKSKNKKICAMQIRNVPHLGHEAVFRYILSNFDMLFLNPIYGIKKKNDFSDLYVSKALKYIKKKYNNTEFDPIWTNFHYAGPREAVHHMLVRQSLGFDYFYVGRDHAGAENLYPQAEAVKIVNKLKKNFKIQPFTSKGGYYCKECKNYVIKGFCKHKNLINISGTDFRRCMRKKVIYKHADKIIQKIIFKI